MSLIKVLYFQHSAASGGAPMSLYYLIKGLSKKIDPVVYFIDDGPAVKYFDSAGIKVKVDHRLARWPHCTIQNQELRPWKVKFYRDAPFYFKQLLKFPLALHAVKEILKKEQPDVVHLNASVLIHEGIAAKYLGVPVVWHLRDFLDHGNMGIRQSILSKIIRFCSTQIIALCQAEADRVGHTNKVNIIANFVEDSFFKKSESRTDLRIESQLPVDSQLIGMLGWSSPDKGAETAIRAMPMILQAVPNAALFLIGTDAIQSVRHLSPLKIMLRKAGILHSPFPLYLRDIARDLGVSHRIFFPGTFFEIADIIRQLNVVLVPFTAPHFARPILEAGALGIPVVASNIDGPKQMIGSGKAGMLAEPGDPASLAQETITALTTDVSKLVETMSRRVQENYNAEQNIEATWKVYSRALHEKQ